MMVMMILSTTMDSFTNGFNSDKATRNILDKKVMPTHLPVMRLLMATQQKTSKLKMKMIPQTISLTTTALLIHSNLTECSNFHRENCQATKLPTVMRLRTNKSKTRTTPMMTLSMTTASLIHSRATVRECRSNLVHQTMVITTLVSLLLELSKLWVMQKEISQIGIVISWPTATKTMTKRFRKKMTHTMTSLMKTSISK